MRFDFTFGGFESSAHISRRIPSIAEIAADAGGGFFRPLIVCDEHTTAVADALCGSVPLPRWVLRAGEANKNWAAVEGILRTAREAGLGRDGLFIGVGGGVASDLCAFAASIYMRGCGLALISTSLLGMVDASLGGKTGFDLFGAKNLAGTFYPARHVYLPLESLASLPAGEWKSGMAELIKTAVLAGDDLFSALEDLAGTVPAGAFDSGFPPGFAAALLTGNAERLSGCVGRAVELKGRIVEADPRETGSERMLLNLGHTFAHALESSAGLGALSHGEAVAWGLVRSCELGRVLGITPRGRAERIRGLVSRYGYETAAPHPLMGDVNAFITALGDDKKKKSGALTFIVPDEARARPWTAATEPDRETIRRILEGAVSF